jgi:hypothetical protein
MYEMHFLDSIAKYKTFQFLTIVNYKIELLFEIYRTTSRTFILTLCRSFCSSYISQNLPSFIHAKRGNSNRRRASFFGEDRREKNKVLAWKKKVANGIE